MNPIDGLFSTFGSLQAALPADTNAPDKLQPVGSGVGSVGGAHSQIFDFSKAEVKVEEKICTNIYR